MVRLKNIKVKKNGDYYKVTGEWPSGSMKGKTTGINYSKKTGKVWGATILYPDLKERVLKKLKSKGRKK